MSILALEFLMKKNSHPSPKGGADMSIIVELKEREILDSRGNPTIPLRFNGGLKNNLEPRSSNLLRVKAVWGVQTTLKGCAFSFDLSAIGYSEYQT